MPYYKWQFRALREIGVPENIYQGLEYLISSGNTDNDCAHKQQLIEDIATFVVQQLIAQNLSRHPTNYMDVQAQVVNDRIKDVNIRNMHLMCTV